MIFHLGSVVQWNLQKNLCESQEEQQQQKKKLGVLNK